MVKICPVKDENFIKLENKFGEHNAYKIWMRFNNTSPHINKYDNLDFSDVSILKYFTFRNSEELNNYLKNSEGITEYKGEFFIKKDDPKSKDRKFGVHKINILKEKYPGLITIKNLGASKDYGIRSITDSQPTLKIDINYDVLNNPTLFQLTSSDTPIDIELNQKLISLLSNYGISVSKVKDFATKYGVNASGMIKIIKSIQNYEILLDENKMDIETLPHETGHFIIEMLGESPLAQRLLNEVSKNDYYKEVLGESYDQYAEQYNNSSDTLIKEAAGQLLGRALISKFKEQQGSNSIFNLLKRLFQQAKQFFNKISGKELNTITTDVFGKTAEDFLKGKLKGLSVENIQGDIDLFEIKDRGLNRLKKLVEDSQKASAKRLQLYRYKDKKSLVKSEEKLLKELSKQIDNDNYIMGAVEVAKHTRNIFRKVIKRVEQLEKDFQDINLLNLREAASTLRDMKSFKDSYLPIIEDLLSEIEDLRKEYPEYKKYDTIVSTLEELRRKAVRMEEDYYRYAVPIFAKFLKPFVGSGPISDITEILKKSDKDISLLQRYLDSMAEVDDPMLQLIDIAVKDAKMDAQIKTLDIQKELIQAKIDLEKAGVPNAYWIYEKLSNGKLSGNIVDKYNNGEYKYQRNKKSEELIKYYKLPQDRTERDFVLSQDAKLKRDYNKDWAEWFKENSQPRPDAETIIESKRNELSKEDFNDWYVENVNISEYTGQEYFTNELTIPSDKYLSKEYQEIQSNPAKLKFYNKIISTIEELDKQLPEKDKLKHLAPQQRKDFMERLKSTKSLKGGAKQIKESISEQFIITEDDTEVGSKYKLTDASGKPIDFIPIHFNNKLKDMDNLSTDIIESLSNFTFSVINYNSMNKIVDILELGRDIIDVRDVIETDSSGNPIVESINVLGKKIENKLKKDPKIANAKGLLEDYYKMQVYGKLRVEGKEINVFGNKIDSAKLIDFLGKYTAINNLALNIYAGVQNIFVGTIQTRIEGMAGQFYNNKNMLYADATYSKELPKFLGQIGSRNHTNKLALWMEYMDVLQNFNESLHDIESERKNIFSKMFKTSSLFFINKAGEHFMQTRSSLALADSIKLKDKNGKEINLFEAFEVVGNKLKIKEGVTKLDGSEWTEKDTRSFVRKQNFINKRLHGIYNDIDKSTIQRYALGRLAMMFRKFMRPGYNRRFRALQYNYEGQDYTEGYYRTTGRFIQTLYKDLKAGQFQLMKNWENLSPVERYNMIRTITEASYLLAAMALVGILSGLDDDDDWLANMTAYQANRLVSELAFYINPSETFRILKSPAAGIDQVNKVINFIETMAPWKAMDVIERGKYKGFTRLHRSAVEVIPLYGTVSDWLTPEDKLVYFTTN